MECRYICLHKITGAQIELPTLGKSSTVAFNSFISCGGGKLFSDFFFFDVGDVKKKKQLTCVKEKNIETTPCDSVFLLSVSYETKLIIIKYWTDRRARGHLVGLGIVRRWPQSFIIQARSDHKQQGHLGFSVADS